MSDSGNAAAVPQDVPEDVSRAEAKRRADLEQRLMARAAEVRSQSRPSAAGLQVGLHLVRQGIAYDDSQVPCENVVGGQVCGKPGVRPWPTLGARCAACARAENEALTAEIEPAAVQQTRNTLVIPPLYENAGFETMELHGDAKNQDRLQRIVGKGMAYVARFPIVPPKRPRGLVGGADDPDFPMILVVRGGTGTGKGHWLWSLARLVSERYNATVVFERVGDVVKNIRATWKGEQSEAAVLRRYREADLLILDELSRHALYGEPTQHLLDIVDPRETARKPTILVTNEKSDVSLAELMGPAVTSRAQRYSGVLEFGDVDYRQTVLVERRRRSRQSQPE